MSNSPLSKYRFELSSSIQRLLNEQQEKAITEDLKFARRYLSVLIVRLEKELDEKIQESESQLNYETPNWELKQAELLGYRRALRKVIQIIGPIESGE